MSEFEKNDNKKNNIILSVIIPMYNVENYIGIIVKQLANQMDERSEIVLINDGSSDKTLAVANELKEKYSDKNITILTQDNKGCSAARNAGLDVIKGSHVTFVDSDDTVKEDYIPAFLRLIEEHPDNDMWITGITIYDVKGNLYEVKTNKDTQINSNEKAINSLIYGDIAIPLSMVCKIIRVEVLKEFGIRFYDEARCMSDSTFLSRVYLRANNVYLSEYAGYEWRRREDSITTTYYPNLPEIVKLYYERCYDLYSKYPSDKTKDEWLLRQKKFVFDYQIGKIDGSKLKGKARKDAINAAIETGLSDEVIEKYYTGPQKKYMEKAWKNKSAKYYEQMVLRHKLIHNYERGRNFILRRVFGKQIP